MCINITYTGRARCSYVCWPQTGWYEPHYTLLFHWTNKPKASKQCTSSTESLNIQQKEPQLRLSFSLYLVFVLVQSRSFRRTLCAHCSLVAILISHCRLLFKSDSSLIFKMQFRWIISVGHCSRVNGSHTHHHKFM